MKIAIIGPAHPLRGGLATYNARLGKELQDKGHNVVLYSFSLQYPNFLFPGKTQFTDEPAPAGLEIRTLINSVNPLNWLAVGNAMKQERFDLVIVRYWLPFMGPALGTILRRSRSNRHTKVVCIADNIIPHEKRPGDKQFTQYFVKAVDGFLTMSRDVLRDLSQFSSKPAFFAPHPVYDTYGASVDRAQAIAHLKLDAAKRYMLFFGFIRDYKGLDILLEAMAQKAARETGAELIVAGEYYDKELAARCADIISTQGLKEKVHLFTDYIPDNEIKYFFSAADVVVQPYKHATQSGITLVAYQFEKPVIVTNVGGLAEMVPDGEAGYIAEPDATSIAGVINKFYTQPMQDIASRLRQEKSKYSWKTFTDNLLLFVKDNL